MLDRCMSEDLFAAVPILLASVSGTQACAALGGGWSAEYSMAVQQPPSALLQLSSGCLHCSFPHTLGNQDLVAKSKTFGKLSI